MNPNRKLTTIYIMAVVVITLILGGWGKPPAKLTVEGLINLDAAIENSIMGVESTDSQQNESASNKNDETEVDKADQESDMTDTNTEPKTIIVEISGKRISYDNAEYETVEELIKHIEETHKGTIKIHLKDNYAEAHVYHTVDDRLFDFCKESGFNYDAD